MGVQGRSKTRLCTSALRSLTLFHSNAPRFARKRIAHLHVTRGEVVFLRRSLVFQNNGHLDAVELDEFILAPVCRGYSAGTLAAVNHSRPVQRERLVALSRRLCLVKGEKLRDGVENCVHFNPRVWVELRMWGLVNIGTAPASE